MAKVSVLVVDDAPFIRDLVKKALRSHFPGVQVEEAVDGRKAQQILSRVSFDLILCDREMPEMNGLQLLQWFRGQPDTAAIPFVRYEMDAEGVLRSAADYTYGYAEALRDGDSVNELMVPGRNGVFYDRDGNDWDATITKIVDSPISVRAAFWSPYKKVLRSVEEFVTKRAAAAEAESDKKVGTALASAESAVDGAPKAVKPAKLDVGVVAALGVAVGGRQHVRRAHPHEGL